MDNKILILFSFVVFFGIFLIFVEIVSAADTVVVIEDQADIDDFNIYAVCAFGYNIFCSYTRVDNSEITWGENSGSGFQIYQGLAQFNISTIPDWANVTQVTLNYTSTNNAGSTNIKPLNGKRITNLTRYPDNESGNGDLFNDLLASINYTGSFDPLSENVNRRYNIGNDTDQISIDLENQLIDDFFVIGFKRVDQSLTIDLGEMGSENHATPSYRIKLEIHYNTGSCEPTGGANWVINETCTIDAKEITMPTFSVILQSGGHLRLINGGNLSFSGTNQFINLTSTSTLNLSAGSNIGG